MHFAIVLATPTDLCVALRLAVVDLVAGLAVLEVEDGEENVAVGPLRLPLHLRRKALLRLCKEGKLVQTHSSLISSSSALFETCHTLIMVYKGQGGPQELTFTCKHKYSLKRFLVRVCFGRRNEWSAVF